MRRTAVAAITAAVMGLMGAPIAAQAETVLRGVSAFPVGNDLTNDFQRYIDMVNERGEGVIQINLMGGPEVMPPQEQGTALANGLFDVLFGPPSYYTGRFPEADAFQGLIRAPQDVRDAGGVEIYDEALARRVNAKILAFAGGDVGLYIFTAEKPEIGEDGLPDLTGMKMRTSPLYTGLFSELGATNIVLPYGDVYTALERGLANGVGWNLVGVKQAGWDEFLNYRIEPEMYRSSLAITINLDRYGALSDEERAILDEVALEYEGALVDFYAERQAAEKAALEEGGVETITLSDDAAEAFQNMAVETMWSMVTDNPAIELDIDKVRAAYHLK